MKFVLIMMWMGLGASNAPALHSTRFEHLAACESAAKQFLEAKTTWTDARYRAAFCVHDAPR